MESLLEGHLVPHPKVLFREIQGEGILLHLESGRYFGLNDVGTRIWQLLVEGRPLPSILTCLEGEFEVSPDVLRHDLVQLTGELRANGLLGAGEASPGA